MRNIERDGKLLFATDKDAVLMTLEQVKIKHEDFLRALSKLRAALEKDISADELYSSRSAIRKAFQTDLTADAEERNLSSHTYDERTARNLSQRGGKIYFLV